MRQSYTIIENANGYTYLRDHLSNSWADVLNKQRN